MPVADSQGTNMIAMIKDIRPPHSWGETPPRQSTTRLRAYSRFPLKMVEVLLVEHMPAGWLSHPYHNGQHDRSLNGLTAILLERE